MKRTIAFALMLATGYTYSATAFFTGNFNMTTTVTYQTGYNCEYSYAGQLFWMVFPEFCPSSVDVQ